MEDFKKIDVDMHSGRATFIAQARFILFYFFYLYIYFLNYLKLTN